MNEFQMQHRFLVKELSLINHDYLDETSFQLKPLFSKKNEKKNDNEYEVAPCFECSNLPVECLESGKKEGSKEDHTRNGVLNENYL